MKLFTMGPWKGYKNDCNEGSVDVINVLRNRIAVSLKHIRWISTFLHSKKKTKKKKKNGAGGWWGGGG